MYCKYCGFECKQDLHYCPKCGNEISTKKDANNPKKKSEKKQPKEKKTPKIKASVSKLTDSSDQIGSKSRNNNIILLGVLIAIVLLQLSALTITMIISKPFSTQKKLSECVDYVIEEGSNGAWSWQKWNNGKIELRASNLTFSPKKGGDFSTAMTYYYCDFSLPVNLKDTKYSVFCTRSSGPTFMVIGCAHNSTNQFRLAVASPQQKKELKELTADLLVIGEWK